MTRRFAVVAVILAAAACSKSTAPVAEEVTQVQLDAVNPTNLSYAATNGLPTEPFHVTVSGTSASSIAKSAAFPDSLKLSATQVAAISKLRSDFETANKADIVTLKGIYEQASAAKKAGKPAADVKAILNLAKPVLARMTARFETLKQAIVAVLTAAQKAWIASHQVPTPPVGWVGPVGPATNP